MQDGDLIAIIRTGGGSGILQQFTTDRRQIEAAVEKIQWNPNGNGGISAFTQDKSENPDSRIGFSGDKDKDKYSSDVAADETYRERYFSVARLGSLNSIIKGMQDLPGRKSVMLFSDGFSLFNRSKSSSFSNSDVREDLNRLVDTANRASVVIYTTEARGLVVVDKTAADDFAESGSKAPEFVNSLRQRKEFLNRTQEGLIFIARETGGLSYINNNDISGGVQQMLDDQSYYLIGYEPDEETFDPKKFNNIEVKVKRKDVNVRYHNGFFGISDNKQETRTSAKLTPKQIILKAVISPFSSNEIPLHLNALFGNDQNNGSYVHTYLHMNAENITFSDLPDGKKNAVFRYSGSRV